MKAPPSHSKWYRKLGGWRTCPRKDCRHRNPLQAKTGGQVIRVAKCQKCGATLAARAEYPKRPELTWYVREYNPETRKTKDHHVGKSRYPNTSEGADKLIAHLRATWTPNEVQERLIRRVTDLCHDVSAVDIDAAIVELIGRLGGEAKVLQAVAWADAIEQVCADMIRRDKLSAVHVAETRSVALDFQRTTGIESCSEVSVQTVRQYGDALRSRKPKRQSPKRKCRGEDVDTLADATIKKKLATLRGFVRSCANLDWISEAVLSPKARAVWAQATDAIENRYMSDADFAKLLSASESRWWWTFLLVAYNTAARRSDLLRLSWDDVDLQGAKRLDLDVDYPHVRIANTKGNRRRKQKRPLMIPLYKKTIDALRYLTDNRVAICSVDCPPALWDVIGCPEVFPVRGYRDPAGEVTKRFGQLCLKAGLYKLDNTGSELLGVPRWTLHSIRMKANMDIGRSGGTIRDQMAFAGHSSAQVNVDHYQTADLTRVRAMVDKLSGFKALKGLRMPA